jgi:hypothetical protein
MRRIHQVDFSEARRLVKALPLDEAEKTVGDYNKKFLSKNGLFRPELHFREMQRQNRHREIHLAVKNSSVLNVITELTRLASLKNTLDRNTDKWR